MEIDRELVEQAAKFVKHQRALNRIAGPAGMTEWEVAEGCVPYCLACKLRDALAAGRREPAEEMRDEVEQFRRAVRRPK